MATFHETSMSGAALRARADTRRAPTPRADPCADPCPPPCPACGGLECFCRPRFFPGQLLTDEALNRLMGYLTGKHRLHNRYLHGWGVACGLEVRCDPCDPKQVIVGTGYALAPCGDDIVLCDEQAVDVCALIDDCTPPARTVCDPPYQRPPADCRGGHDRWVLAVCYDERPTRGLTALLGAGDSRCRQPCGCGGSAGCARCGGSGCAGGAGCSCGGAGPGSCAGAGAGAGTRPRAERRAECEPTLVCEGHRFMVYPAPARLTRAPLPDFGNDSTGALGGTLGTLLAWMFAHRERLGPLLERVLCCMARARELLASWGASTRVDAAVAGSAYLSYAEAMHAFASEFAVHRCAFVGTVDRLYDSARVWRATYGDAGELDQAQLTHVRTQLVEFENLLLEIVGECFCSALLPPCPDDAPRNCVPLAVVTLRQRDCRVVDICNWEQRRILLTWRTVGYWLSWIPWHCLRHEIARFCCGSERGGSFVLRLMSLMFGVGAVGLLCGERTAAAPAVGIVGAVPGGAFGTPRAAAAAAPGAAATGASATSGLGANDSASNAKAQIGNVDAARRADDLVLHLLAEFDRARSGQADAPPWYALAARLADGTLLADLAATRRTGGAPAPEPDGGYRTDPALEQSIAELRAEVAELRKAMPQPRSRSAARPKDS
jgi:hypothetical protein